MTDKRVVLTTCASAEEARHIAHELVNRRLAACVNIVSQVESMYRWKDEVETAAECLLIIKTTAAAFQQLRGVLEGLHSYDVPECISIPIDEGSASYLDWIAGSVDAQK